MQPAPAKPRTEIDRAPKRKLEAKDRKNGGKGRAKVRFRFSSPAPGAGFECSLRPRRKQPRFKDCESPASYELAPGKYRFAVRAVVAGGRDPSPETFSFRVVRKKL